MWQWCNWLAEEARLAGKLLLLLNLDETSIPLAFTHAEGNVMLRNSTKRWTRSPRQPTTRPVSRSFFTYVALICNVPEIQPLLPQILLVSSHLLSHQNNAIIQDELPQNVYVKRLTSGWNTTKGMTDIIRLLCNILQPFMEQYQPVLMFDAVPLHLADEVFAELANVAFWHAVIPARMTWLLQPLDTHAFVKFKRFLKTRFQDGGPYNAGGNLTLRMMRLVISAIRQVLEARRWDAAFANDGLAGDQDTVSSYIQHQLEYEQLPAYPPLRPSEESLRLCWPRNKTVHAPIVLAALPPDLAAPAAALAAVPPLLALPPPQEAPQGNEALSLQHLLRTQPAPAPSAASSSSAAVGGAAPTPPPEAMVPAPAPTSPRLRRRTKTSSQ